MENKKVSGNIIMWAISIIDNSGNNSLAIESAKKAGNNDLIYAVSSILENEKTEIKND